MSDASSQDTPETDATAPAAGGEAAPPPPPEQALQEALTVFFAATALCAALYWTGQAVPFVGRNLGGFVALVFLIIPIQLLDRRREPLARYGIGWRPLGPGLLWGLGSVIVVLGLFVAVYLAYYDAVCDRGWGLLGPLGRRCETWRGLGGGSFGLPAGFWELLLGQIVVVAIPEEIFYRGYLLGRLEQAFPPRRRFLGVYVGWALILHALLFGLGHFLVDLNPLRLAVALPALFFGYLRLRTGSILAPVIFHAAANLLMALLDPTFF